MHSKWNAVISGKTALIQDCSQLSDGKHFRRNGEAVSIATNCVLKLTRQYIMKRVRLYLHQHQTTHMKKSRIIDRKYQYVLKYTPCRVLLVQSYNNSRAV